MQFSKWENFFVVLIMLAVFVAGASFFLPDFKNYFPKQVAAIVATGTATKNIIQDKIPLPSPPPQKLSNPPEVVKAVYVTGWSAGTRSYLNYLSNLFNNTEINAVVIDIKGSSGYVSYASGAEDVKKYNLDNDAISDIDSLVRFLHEKNIYVIGRIAVFEDPVYSKANPQFAVYNKEKTTDVKNPVLWEDNHKLSWLDPASKDVWDYNISLAKDALYHGFDEINFDYIRFPSDGKTENMGFPVWDGKTQKSEIIKGFFQYIRQQIPNDKISADLFGQTTVNTDDMGIGQVMENAFNYFDYLCPMVYPSHYINGFIGFANPADHPYEVIKYSMQSAVMRQASYLQSEETKTSEAQGTPAFQIQALNPSNSLKPVAKFRPWLQDFNMGAVYNADMVKQEINALQDVLGKDFKGFMLWNPSNIYTQSAVLKPN